MEQVIRPTTLVFIRGLPGSGKSLIATTLAARLGGDTCILDPDYIDFSDKTYIALTDELRAQGLDEKFYPYRFLRARAYSAIENGEIVVWNQAFTNLESFRKTVENLEAFAHEHGLKPKTLVVEVKIDIETAQKRLMERKAQGGHVVDDEAFARFKNDFASFTDEGFTVLEVDGNNPAEVSADRVIMALEKLGRA